jgi:hypothetical protein
VRARHRCPRCKNTFSKRLQLEDHLHFTCSDEARARRRRDTEELSARLAAHEEALAEMGRDGERRRRAPVFGIVLQIFDFSEIFRSDAGGEAARLDPPDLLNARKNEDGTFST